MSKAIDKEKLLEWLEALYEPTMGNEEWNTVISKIQEEIESGTFDLPDVDEIGELDNANRLMHERNKRLEAELEEWKQTAIKHEESLKVQDGLISELQANLNKALEALEKIKKGEFGKGMYLEIVYQAIQEIKGEKA